MKFTWTNTYGERTINPFYEDIRVSAHTLIGGKPGSGKSNLIENWLCYMLEGYMPCDVNFILCDPKRVDLQDYKNLPHVLRYASEREDIINILKGCITIMDSRYKQMKNDGLRKYEGTEIYIVIDELGDLMLTHGKSVLPLLQRLAQLGRAANIHLVCATQCPNRKVIPAQLVCLFDMCIALKCKSAIESRQIINESGAELLPRYGKGIASMSFETKVVDIPLLDIPHLHDVIADWIRQGNENGFYIAKAEAPKSSVLARKDTYTEDMIRIEREIHHKIWDDRKISIFRVLGLLATIALTIAFTVFLINL